MIDINLVRNRIEPLPEGVERLSGFVVAVLVFSYFFTAVILYGWRYHLQQSARPVEAKYEVLRVFHEESDQHYSLDFWKRYRAHLDLLEQCRDYARAKHDCSGILADIAESAEKSTGDVVLDSITLGPSTLEIHGRTRPTDGKGPQKIRDFVRYLRDSRHPLLQQTEQKEYSAGKERSRSSGYEFTLMARR